MCRCVYVQFWLVTATGLWIRNQRCSIKVNPEAHGLNFKICVGSWEKYTFLQSLLTSFRRTRKYYICYKINERRCQGAGFMLWLGLGGTGRAVFVIDDDSATSHWKTVKRYWLSFRIIYGKWCFKERARLWIQSASRDRGKEHQKKMQSRKMKHKKKLDEYWQVFIQWVQNKTVWSITKMCPH